MCIEYFSRKWHSAATWRATTLSSLIQVLCKSVDVPSLTFEESSLANLQSLTKVLMANPCSNGGLTLTSIVDLLLKVW